MHKPVLKMNKLSEGLYISSIDTGMTFLKASVTISQSIVYYVHVL